MFELRGKYNTAKVFTNRTDNVMNSQLIEFLNQEYSKDSTIRIMPDCHAGKGCVIGTTMTIHGKVNVNMVGVDIGCLDKDTEILTPQGWLKISDYKNEQILMYDTVTDMAFFDYPKMYLKGPCDEFIHFKNSKNLDQMVSTEHHMIVYTGNKHRGYIKNDFSAIDFEEKLSGLKKADNYTTKTTFQIDNKGLNYTDNDIRIFVMLSADARLRPLKNGNTYVELHFKKQRKINRACKLLCNAHIPHKVSVYGDGSTCIMFTTNKYTTKDLTQFYLASIQQLQVLCDEVCFWDGTVDAKRNHRTYYTTNKVNADVVQFAYNATGIRSCLYVQKNVSNPKWKRIYTVQPTMNAYVSYRVDTVTRERSIDGYKYCFNTDTGSFVIRRNNKISITGNCGMLTIPLTEKEIDFAKLDEVINKYVPSGMNVHQTERNYNGLENLVATVSIERAKKSLGTLGGGNHFIEIDIDDNGNYYLVIHSGSRHLGKEIAEYHHKKAIDYCQKSQGDMRELVAKLKAEGHEKEISAAIEKLKATPKVPKELSYLEGALLDDYLNDMKIAQKFACDNRKAIALAIVENMNFDKSCFENAFETIHNYIDFNDNVLRKGAVSAHKGETLLIPMNMRDGSLICVGKGNEDWNCSAPHGAGRLMSRSEAKTTVSIEEFAESMKGIYSTSVCESTLDESPMAYKPMDEIIANIEPTVDIVKVIKPVYNFKAH